MSNIYITLNDVEQALVKYVTKKRIAYDLQIGAVATVYGDKNLEELHIGSYGAELAFCKMHNIYPDLNYMEHRDEDCVTAVGHRIDVKWNAREDGWLSAKVKPRNNPPDKAGRCRRGFGRKPTATTPIPRSSKSLPAASA